MRITQYAIAGVLAVGVVLGAGSAHAARPVLPSKHEVCVKWKVVLTPTQHRVCVDKGVEYG